MVAAVLGTGGSEVGSGAGTDVDGDVGGDVVVGGGGGDDGGSERRSVV